MTTISNIIQDKVEVIPIWGGFKVQTTATVTVKSGKNEHKENYTVLFERDQVSGVIKYVECVPRKERTTTEHTLTPEVIKELVYDKLNN